MKALFVVNLLFIQSNRQPPKYGRHSSHFLVTMLHTKEAAHGRLFLSTMHIPPKGTSEHVNAELHIKPVLHGSLLLEGPKHDSPLLNTLLDG